MKVIRALSFLSINAFMVIILGQGAAALVSMKPEMASAWGSAMGALGIFLSVEVLSRWKVK